MSKDIKTAPIPPWMQSGTRAAGLHKTLKESMDLRWANPSYRNPEFLPTHYRKPSDHPSTQDRRNGNTIFRRYPNGKLDLDAAKHEVVDIIHKLKMAGILLPVEKATLSSIFPDKYKLVDPIFAKTIIPLTKEEKRQIAELVEAHFKEEENWNAGYGGGSVPGRNRTYF